MKKATNFLLLFIKRYFWLALCGCLLAAVSEYLVPRTFPFQSGISLFRSFVIVIQMGYLFALPLLCSDIHEKSGIWSDSRTRDLGIVFVGLSIGAFYACWHAMRPLSHEELSPLFQQSIGQSFNIETMLPVDETPRRLFEQAKAILVLKTLNEYALSWISGCTLATMALFKLSDRLHANFAVAAFTAFFFFPLPLWALVTFYTPGYGQAAPSLSVDYMLFGALTYLCGGCMWGVFGICYVRFARSTWWQGAQLVPSVDEHA